MSAIEQWARKYIHFPEGERWPGKFRLRNPAMAAWFEAACDPATRRLTIRASTQTGKSTALEVISLWSLEHGGGPHLWFEPTLALKKEFAKRIWDKARLCPPLANAFARLRPTYERDTGKGRISVIAAKQTDALIARPGRVVILDELAHIDEEIVTRAESRQVQYENAGALFIAASSAGDAGLCKTTELLERSDYRVWEAPCPSCGVFAELDFNRVTWQGKDPNSAGYVCGKCGVVHSPQALADSNFRGRYRATKTADDPGSIGFHVNALSSPLPVLPVLVRRWISAENAYKQTGSRRELMDFSRDVLAEPFKSEGALEAAHVQRQCKEVYPVGALPAWVFLITCGVDVQDDRLELSVDGWGAIPVEEGNESRFPDGREPFPWKAQGKYWRLRRAGVGYFKLHGDPGSGELWARLDQLLSTRWRIGDAEEGPAIGIALALVDAGGHYTAQTQAFSRSRNHRVGAIKGASKPGSAMARRSLNRDVREQYGQTKGLVICGVDVVKGFLFNSIRQSVSTEGERMFVWPRDNAEDAGFGLGYFEGLVESEILSDVISKQTGRRVRRWRKRPGVPNEPLDTACYSFAALYIVGLERVIANAAALEAGRPEG